MTTGPMMHQCPRCGHSPHRPGECRAYDRSEANCPCDADSFAAKDAIALLDAWQAAGDYREYTVRRSPSYGGTEVEVVLTDRVESPAKVVSQLSGGPNVGIYSAVTLALERWVAGDFDPEDKQEQI